MGVNGMVASAHPLATQAGIRMLQAGGNAMDAIVATASTLNVVEPFMSGIGGIGVALVYVAKEDRVRVLNFSGCAPMAATPDRFADKEASYTGILSPLVPGNAAGWLTLHETYGKLDREQVLQPVIDYAENGVPVTYLSSHIMQQNTGRIGQFPTSAAIVLDSSGNALKPGARLYMKQLAESYRLVAREGKSAFYTGELGERIVRSVREVGGLLTMDDLAGYQPEWEEPIGINYRGYRILTSPPNSTGFQTLQTMKLLEGYGLTHQDPDTVHTMMEAVKLAVTDRTKWAGDPAYVKPPLGGLLSDGYAAKQRARIDMERAASVMGEHYVTRGPQGALTPGSPEEFDGGMTTHFAAADSEGNVVSITQSLGGYFGSGVAIGDTGIFLNNMCFWFDLEPDSPNVIAPGKKVDFVLSPTHTFKEGKFFLSMGTPGSWGIMQTTPQMLVNVLDYGMNVQQAIESPRFRYYAERNVDMEERFPLHVRLEMERRGHKVAIVEEFSRNVGGGHAIQVNQEHGTFEGGADPRRDGYAIGW